MSTFEPTAEQAAIVEAFRRREDLVVEAGAGSGKTSTLRLLATAVPRATGLYIAYNKAIAGDAQRSFPRSVSCSTAHSLAFRAVGRTYRARLDGPRLPARETARILGIRMRTQIGEKILAPNQVARIVTDTVARFCHSDSTRVEARHVPVLAGVDGHAEQAELKAIVLPLARKAWEDIQSHDGRLKFQHDHYLKIWQLSSPRLPADYVMLDEAQDADPVIASVVTAQGHAQRTLVGDRAQAIYGWRGAIDAMSTFDGTRLMLSQSFRFGPDIAAEANKWLGLLDTPLRVRGTPSIPSRVAHLDGPDAVLCRSNAEAMAQVMEALSADRKVSLVGGGRDIASLAEAAASLKAGVGCNHPELFVFRTWREVQEYVEQDSAGADLRVFVNLIDEHGPDKILDAVDRMVDERSADVVISTAHKAKGREWASVRIADDFREPRVDEDGNQADVPRDEAMLAYVAVTRARLVLDRGGLSWVDRYLLRDSIAQTRAARIA